MANNYIKCGRCKGEGAINGIIGKVDCHICKGVGKIHSKKLQK